MKYSVIDISSSSISMIVAESEGGKTEVIFKERSSLSLVHYLEDGALSERGIQKLIEMLARCKDMSAGLGVERGYLIATAALRHVKNFDEVAAAVLAETELTVNLIDGTTEAYCDYIANLYYKSFDRPVLIDLGGKSIEICDLAKSSKDEMMSIPFGLIDLYRKFVSGIYPDEKEAKDIRRYAKKKFDEAGIPEEGVYSTAIIVGATGAAIYDIYAEFSDETTSAGVRTIRRKKFKKLVDHLLTGEDRSRLVLNNAPEKLYLIGSAAIVLKLLFKRFNVENIIVSERGVKEGYLQLVLEGKESGAYYDFVRGGADGEARKLPAPETLKKTAKSAAKRKKAKSSAKGKAKPASEEAQTSSDEKPAKRCGRPKKQPAQQSEASAQVQSAQALPDEKPAKRRGRPKKQPAQQSEASAQVQSAQTLPDEKPAKRRGRPKKSAAEQSDAAMKEGAEKEKPSRPLQETAASVGGSVQETAAVETAQASAAETSGTDETKSE